MKALAAVALIVFSSQPVAAGDSFRDLQNAYHCEVMAWLAQIHAVAIPRGTGEIR